MDRMRKNGELLGLSLLLPAHHCYRLRELCLDPYVVVEMAGEKQRSSAIDDGGAAPVWGGGKGNLFPPTLCAALSLDLRQLCPSSQLSFRVSGEELEFHPMSAGVPHIELKCFDCDAGLVRCPLHGGPHDLCTGSWCTATSLLLRSLVCLSFVACQTRCGHLPTISSVTQ